MVCYLKVIILLTYWTLELYLLSWLRVIVYTLVSKVFIAS